MNKVFGASTQGSMGGAAGQQGFLPRWWLITNAVAALAGLLLALYSRWHHRLFMEQGVTDFSCNISAAVSCDAIAASSYSELWGIPLAEWGCAYFAALLVVVLLLGVTRAGSKVQLVAYSMLVVLGLVVSGILAGISIWIIKVFCPVCWGLYAIIVLIVGLAIKKHRILRGAWAMEKTGKGLGGVFFGFLEILVIFALVLGGCHLTKKQGSTTPPEAPKTKNETPAPSHEPSLSEVQLAAAKEEIPLATTPYMGSGEDFRVGNDAEAKVTIQVFSDFQCPACARVHEQLHALKDEFGDKLRVVFRNYPLDHSCNPAITRPMHQSACKVAALARCAGQKNKFWEFADRVFKQQGELEAKAETWAQELGLSPEEVAACVASESIKAKIKDDILLGNRLEVDATPTLFLNNRKFFGPSRDALSGIIRELLAQ
jgi:protein-disulfide isomerase/uncharacterized membrane protein